MNVLAIAGDGRGHALISKLAQSDHVSQICAVPGNPGIGEEILLNGWPVMCRPFPENGLDGLLEIARIFKPDLTVVSSEHLLAESIVDVFTEAGFRIFGPTRRAAEFESSKAFTQEFMQKYGVPCPRGQVYSEPELALLHAYSLKGICVVKPDGFADGKGSKVCTDIMTAKNAIENILVRLAFGFKACQKLVIQEFLPGPEASMHLLSDGKNLLPFESSKDHKRLLDGNEGPMTGGMGVVSPAPGVSEKEFEAEGKAIMAPWLHGCDQEGIEFRGLIYPGVIRGASGMKVIEFNTRFGDPEAQSYMARLDNDLFELLWASTESDGLKNIQLKWKPETAINVVLTSRGYPERTSDKSVIVGVAHASKLPNVKIFHAGTEKVGDALCTNGGRVLSVTAWDKDLTSARARVYDAIEKVYFDGMHYRKDIGIAT